MRRVASNLQKAALSASDVGVYLDRVLRRATDIARPAHAKRIRAIRDRAAKDAKFLGSLSFYEDV